MTDNKTVLKPCPFCGGKVEIEEAEPTFSQIHGNRRWWGVVCRNTTNLGGTCAIQQRPSASKESAIERWNRRATSQQSAQGGEVVAPAGWKLVPFEPMDAQQAAGAQAVRIETTLINKMYTANRVYRDMVAAAPVAPSVPSAAKDAEDAARYRWLREQQHYSSNMFVVSGSKDQIRLGTYCPSLELLDFDIDAAIAAANAGKDKLKLTE